MTYPSSIDGIDYHFLANAGSAAWHRHLASLMRTAGQRDFPCRLEQVLKAVTGFDTILISTYKGRHRPLLIHDNYPTESRQQAIDRYLSGAYLLDPFFTAMSGGLDSGAYRLRELAPDRFESSEYYAHYYRTLGLEDEVGLCARVGEDVVMMVSLGFKAEMPLEEAFVAGAEKCGTDDRNPAGGVLEVAGRTFPANIGKVHPCGRRLRKLWPRNVDVTRTRNCPPAARWSLHQIGGQGAGYQRWYC